MKESEIESHLKRRVEALGGKCWKWVSPGRLGVPDRILILPGGIIWFVETKAPGKRERASQVYVQTVLRNLGCTVWPSVDSKERVDDILNYYERQVRPHADKV